MTAFRSLLGALALVCLCVNPSAAETAIEFAAAGMGQPTAQVIVAPRRHIRQRRESARRAYAQSSISVDSWAAPRIVAEASKYIGARNPMRFAGPGCKVFVNMVASRVGYYANASARAFDTRGMGQRVAYPQPGDYRVSSRRGGGHVEIVASVEGGRVTTINGNKGRNRVGWSHRSVAGAAYYRPIRVAGL